MRNLTIPLCLMLSMLVTAATRAQDEAPKDNQNEDRAARRAAMREKILKEFDADGDGELSDDERATAREAMRERRAKKGKGKAGKGKRGRRGPGGPPDPAKLFKQFDANNDGQLSREEFMKLTKAMRERRDRGKEGRRRGPRPDGPPPEGSSLEIGGRGFNVGEGEGSGRKGARGEGHHRKPPSPEKVFEKFDANDDSQLSRDEFMKLADHMREMRERHRHRRGHHHRGKPDQDGKPHPSHERDNDSSKPESPEGPELPDSEGS